MADPAATPRFKVKRVKLETTSDRIAVGAGFACFLTLEDPLLADEHCEITYEKGKFYVLAKKSITGTFLNGVPVVDRAEIEDGAEIILGVSRLRISIQNADSPDGGTLEIEARAKDFYFEEKGDLKSSFSVRPDVDYWVDSEVTFGRYKALVVLNLVAALVGGILLGLGLLPGPSHEALVDPGPLYRTHAAFFADPPSVEQAAFLANFTDGKYAQIANEQGCNACHAPFGGTPAESCKACHEPIYGQHPYDREESADQACNVCHVDHDNAANFLPDKSMTSTTCSNCHDDAPWDTVEGVDPDTSEGVRFTVAYTGFEHSQHLDAEGKVLDCTACHGSARESDEWWDPSYGREFAIVDFETCMTCHADDPDIRTAKPELHATQERNLFKNDWHGADEENRENCLGCHSELFEPEMKRTQRTELLANFEFSLLATGHGDDIHKIVDVKGRQCTECHWNEDTLQARSTNERFFHGLHMSALGADGEAAGRLSGTSEDSGQAGTCLGCHRELRTSSELSENAYRGATLDSCEDCHQGSPAASIERSETGQPSTLAQPRVVFPHDKHLEFTGDLAGGCFACHEFSAPRDDSMPWGGDPLRVRADIAETCGECHQGHKNILGGGCAACHTPTDPVYKGENWDTSWDGSSGFRHLSPGHAEITDRNECAECHDAADGKDVRVPRDLENSCVECHIQKQERLHWDRPTK